MQHSSFEKDKKRFDEWRQFLNEQKWRRPTKLKTRRGKTGRRGASKIEVQPKPKPKPLTPAEIRVQTAAGPRAAGGTYVPRSEAPAALPAKTEIPPSLVRDPDWQSKIDAEIPKADIGPSIMPPSINPPPYITSGLPDSPAAEITNIPQNLMSDPNISNSLRAIAVSQEQIPIDVLNQLELAKHGRNLPANLAPWQIKKISDSYRRSLPELAAAIDRERSIQNMQNIGVVPPPHQRMGPVGEVPAQPNAPLATSGPGTETGYKHGDIEKNIDNIIRQGPHQALALEPAIMTSPMGATPSQGQWSYLEPTRDELATGIPRWKGLEEVYTVTEPGIPPAEARKRAMKRHRDVGLARVQTMIQLHDPGAKKSYALAPRFYGYNEESAIIRATKDVDRSLTTDEIVDLAKTSLYADNRMAYKLAVDMYRHLEAQGKLPYQRLPSRDSLRPWRARNREWTDLEENKLQYIIKDEYQKLLLEFKR